MGQSGRGEGEGGEGGRVTEGGGGRCRGRRRGGKEGSGVWCFWGGEREGEGDWIFFLLPGGGEGGERGRLLKGEGGLRGEFLFSESFLAWARVFCSRGGGFEFGKGIYGGLGFVGEGKRGRDELVGFEREGGEEVSPPSSLSPSLLPLTLKMRSSPKNPKANENPEKNPPSLPLPPIFNPPPLLVSNLEGGYSDFSSFSFSWISVWLWRGWGGSLGCQSWSLFWGRREL